MTLSVCIICKNEEKNIDRCLKSIKDLADEIIIVDTGSTDKTLEIAKSYNTKIFNSPWDNDFSKPRNISIQNATCDWILILDADEEIDNENCLKIKNTLKNYPNYEGFYLTISNITNSKETNTGVVFRLFKRNPQYIFQGKLHEQIIDSVFIYHTQDKILDTDIKIRHYGYGTDLNLSKKKSKRNLEILLSYKESDKNAYYYYSLGNEYIRTRDSKKCIECYEKSIILSNFPNEKVMYFPYLIFNLVKLLLLEEKSEEAFICFNKYIDYYPDFKDFYFLGSVCAIKLEKFSFAKTLMDLYNVTNPSHNFYPSNNLDNDFNMAHISKAIENGLFIEKNPASKSRLPLIIGIINTCSEDKIENCLKSIDKLNCNKILLTTQKLSNNKDLESTYNLQIINKTFENSYASTKNQLLKYINDKKEFQNKWILILDSHESLTYDGLLKLQSILTLPHRFKAFYLELVNESNITYKSELKLFIQDSRLCFRDKLYEEILTSCVKSFGKESIQDTDIKVLSFIDKNKVQERREVFNSYKEYEKDDLYYFYKGNDYFKNNNFYEAVSMYKKSLELEKNLVGYIIPSPKVLLSLNLCLSLLNLRNYEEALYYSNLFLKEFEEFATLYIIKSYCEKMLGLLYTESFNKYYKYKENSDYPFVYLEHLLYNH